MKNAISCPKCNSENKELYMTHGQVVGHRWICKDCGKVYYDEASTKNIKKTYQVLGIILGISVLFLIMLIALAS